MTLKVHSISQRLFIYIYFVFKLYYYFFFLSTLEQRRFVSRLVMMYRMQYGLINVSSDHTTKSHSLRGHPMMLQQI